MLTLAVLLQVAGLIFTFSMGVVGYFMGPACIVGGALLYRREQRRRKELALNPQPVQPPLPHRPGWQRFLVGFGAVVVAFTAIFALAWRLTAGMADSVDGFFLALRDGNIAEARKHLAQDFNASTSDEQLRGFVRNSALGDYQSAFWSSREVINSRGNLEGTINTRNGGSIPMRVELVKENGDWKIFSLRKPEAGIHTNDQANKPGEMEQMRLVNASTALFADAVQRRDFAEMHRRVAGLWQRQVTTEQMATAFKSFGDSGTDFSVLLRLQPQVSAAAYDNDGAFVIEGTYPTKPSAFAFRYSYVYEGVDWKLVGIHAAIE